MKKALQGATVAFIVTPGAEDRAKLVASAVDVAKTVGVQHIVVVSVTCVKAKGALLFKNQCTEIGMLCMVCDLISCAHYEL